MMGATTLKGAIDAEFRVKSDDRVVTVESGKTKDDAPASFTFETRVVDVVDPVSRKPMLTRKGKQVTTLTLELAALSASSASCPSTKLKSAPDQRPGCAAILADRQQGQMDAGEQLETAHGAVWRRHRG